MFSKRPQIKINRRQYKNASNNINSSMTPPEPGSPTTEGPDLPKQMKQKKTTSKITLQS